MWHLVLLKTEQPGHDWEAFLLPDASPIGFAAGSICSLGISISVVLDSSDSSEEVAVGWCLGAGPSHPAGVKAAEEGVLIWNREMVDRVRIRHPLFLSLPEDDFYSAARLLLCTFACNI